jgi:predicted lipoprotein with Yx(FWY)xxD motif
MSGPLNSARSRRRSLSVGLLVAVVAGLAVFAVAGLALAKSFTLGAAQNVKIITSASTKHAAIAVNGRGRSVYELRPETVHHPLCTKGNGCFQFWPPVTVPSAKTKLTAAPGVKGKLGIWHRNGLFQVTLAGHPLYTFVEDSGKGVANGDTLKSFKGTWHVIHVGSSSKSTQTTPTTATIPMTPYPSGY